MTEILVLCLALVCLIALALWRKGEVKAMLQFKWFTFLLEAKDKEAERK